MSCLTLTLNLTITSTDSTLKAGNHESRALKALLGIEMNEGEPDELVELAIASQSESLTKEELEVRSENGGVTHLVTPS